MNRAFMVISFFVKLRTNIGEIWKTVWPWPPAAATAGPHDHHPPFAVYVYRPAWRPIRTDVIVSDPPTGLSLNSETGSPSSFSASEYNRGRKCSGVGMARSNTLP